MDVGFISGINALYDIKISNKQKNCPTLKTMQKDEFVKFSNVNFEGLQRVIRKNVNSNENSIKKLTKRISGSIFLNEDSIINMANRYPQANGIIGNLPVEWIMKIPKENRKDKIKKLYEDFGQTISELRINKQTSENIKIASVKINAALHEAGILDETQIVNLNPLESCTYGTGYLLEENFTTKNNQYVFKVFHELRSGKQDHGSFIETNKAAYWRRNAGGGTQRVKLNISDTKNGYTIMKYIGKFTPPPKKIVPLKRFGLHAYDEVKDLYGKNRINGHSIDYGGIEIKSIALANNKRARNVYNKIKKESKPDRLSKWYKIYASNKRDTNTLMGLAEAIKILEDKVEPFKTLAVRPNNSIRLILVDKFDLLPRKLVLEYFEDFAKKADNPMKVALIGKFDLLPEESFLKYFEDFSKKADNLMKVALIDKFDLLPSELVPEYFEKFIKNADSSVKKALIKKLYKLEEKEHVKNYYNDLSIGADNSDKVYLIKKLYLLTPEEVAEYFRLFFDGADDAVIQALKKQTYLLPKDQVKTWEELLA